jgi:hypothetical protein
MLIRYVGAPSMPPGYCQGLRKAKLTYRQLNNLKVDILSSYGRTYPLAEQVRTQAEARRRHGTNDIGKATNGSSGARGRKYKNDETGYDKCRRHDCARRKVKEDNGSGNGGTGDRRQEAVVMTAAMAMRDARSAGQDKGIGGGGEEQVLT